MYEVRAQPCAVACQSVIGDDKEKKGVEESNRDYIRHGIRHTERRENTNEVLSCCLTVFPRNLIWDLKSNGETWTVQHMISAKRLIKFWDFVRLVGFTFDFKIKK